MHRQGGASDRARRTNPDSRFAAGDAVGRGGQVSKGPREPVAEDQRAAYCHAQRHNRHPGKRHVDLAKRLRGWRPVLQQHQRDFLSRHRIERVPCANVLSPANRIEHRCRARRSQHRAAALEQREQLASRAGGQAAAAHGGAQEADVAVRDAGQFRRDPVIEAEPRRERADDLDGAEFAGSATTRYRPRSMTMVALDDWPAEASAIDVVVAVSASAGRAPARPIQRPFGSVTTQKWAPSFSQYS